MPILLFTIFLLIIIAVLIYFLLYLLLKNKKLKLELAKLNKSFDNLDLQAKLIIKTDLELNKAQEELDKRLNALDALQKTSRLISTTLDEKEIFHRLNQTLMIDLGFERNLICTFNETKQLVPRVFLGYSNDDAHFILSNFEKESNLKLALQEGHAFSSISSPKQRKETLIRLFDVDHYVIAPILSQNGVIGIVFVGNKTSNLAITAGDEELISILANQIGQSLENARLFEQVYRSSQELEIKVTDRTKRLASALDEVKNISKTKSEFISAVSHELRTPLTSIKGYASILMAGKLGEVPQAVKERLGKINSHSDNLVKLINDLLDISRIESGKVTMKKEKSYIVKIIDTVYDLLTPQMKEKNINWKSKISNDIPEMVLDTTQIERVFINLMSNAIKFTPEGGSISVNTYVNNNNVITEVSDTGIGIDKEDVKRLFSEFFRAENAINLNIKGTGLGLALAKKIIEAHNGSIWVTSELNKGTTFHFSLPFNIS